MVVGLKEWIESAIGRITDANSSLPEQRGGAFHSIGDVCAQAAASEGLFDAQVAHWAALLVAETTVVPLKGMLRSCEKVLLNCDGDAREALL